MQTKTIVSIIIAVVVIGGLALWLGQSRPKEEPTASAPASQMGEQDQLPPSNEAVQPDQTPAATGGVSAVSTNNGSVAGVDLSEFGTEANQSASLAGQDDATDQQAVSGDGSSINSSLDAVSNPIQ